MKAVDLAINISFIFLPFSQKSVWVVNKNYVEPWGNSGDWGAKKLWKSRRCGGTWSKISGRGSGKFSIAVHGGEPGFSLEQPLHVACCIYNVYILYRSTWKKIPLLLFSICSLSWTNPYRVFREWNVCLNINLQKVFFYPLVVVLHYWTTTLSGWKFKLESLVCTGLIIWGHKIMLLHIILNLKLEIVSAFQLQMDWYNY